jgi:hypothetical protein
MCQRRERGSVVLRTLLICTIDAARPPNRRPMFGRMHSLAIGKTSQRPLRSLCGQRLNKRNNSIQRRLVHPSEDSARQLWIEGVDGIDADGSRAVAFPLR